MAPKKTKNVKEEPKKPKEEPKKPKEEPEEPKEEPKKPKEEPKKPKEEPKKPKDAKKIDQLWPVKGQIYGDYDCMLNMTNIEKNMNKFYAIQVIVSDSKFYCRILSGRVGEKNKPQDKSQSDLESAVEMFKKKFKTKTKKEWKDRGNLQYHPGKYTLIELDGDEDAEVKTDIKKMPLGNLSKRQIDKGIAVLEEIKEVLNTPSSELNSELEELISKFKSTMQIGNMPLGIPSQSQNDKGNVVLEDMKAVLNRTKELSSKFYSTIPHKSGHTETPTIIGTMEILKEKEKMLQMPLGNLSKRQIDKGIAVLEEIKKALNRESQEELEELSSKFYSTIPHNTGIKRPTIINTMEILKEKEEMLQRLADIKAAGAGDGEGPGGEGGD